MTFVIFAGICFAVAKTIATALVSSRLDYCNSLYHNTLYCSPGHPETSTCAKLFDKGSYTVSSFLSHYHFLHHCIGSLSDIALFFKICTLTYQVLSSKQTVSFDHLILIYFLFPVLTQMSELELFQLLQRLSRTRSLLLLSL